MSFKDVTFLRTADSGGSQVYVEQFEDIRTFIAGGTIVAGDWVALNFAASTTGALSDVGTVIAAGVVATGNPAVIGVATTGASSTQTVQVQVAGYIASCKCVAASAGLGLVCAGTTAGTAEAIAAADLARQCGIALDASADDLAPCWILRGI